MQQRSLIAGIDAMELTSNHSFPRHSHDQYGVGVLLSGAQRSWSGIGPVESFPGDVITVNPGEMHDGIPVDRCVRRWRILYFDQTYLAREMMREMTREVEFISPSLRNPSLQALVQSLFNHVMGDPLAAEESLVRAIAQLLSPDRRPRASSKRLTPAIAKVRARIDADPAGRMTLSDLAALAEVGRYHLIRAFAGEVGATPHAYVVQRRVRLARQLLLQGAALADAAQQAGFADQSHMSRAFVRQYGVPPGRYIAARA
jgi:AraC-like DNA-binding protein